MSESRKELPQDSLHTNSVQIPEDGRPPDAEGTVLSEDPFKTQCFVQPDEPTHLGRYAIKGYLGRGGFGVVYRAQDDLLGRSVAIKVPHEYRVQSESERKLYLFEAQTVAQLYHPGVVPVYDFGVLPDNRCFVVSKLIDGRSLAQVLSSEHLPIDRCVALLVSVAEALHYVHSQKLIHRDIKPGNLLVDQTNQIFVADFGLAVHEADSGKHQPGAGTPNYMSPEQAGGEGHRIDSRTDLYSLGVVMYEMLTGTRPIQGDTFEDTKQKLISQDPVPLVSHDPSIPVELNRICLKLLSKRAKDRYQSGQELADDLKHFQSPNVEGGFEGEGRGELLTSGTGVPATPGKFIPRGLRSYDRHDAYFFLQLLPGPFDRDGLPENLSHWQRWVEQPEDLPELHRIGVIAGPSGCGKSSLIKAGLVPLLNKATVSTLMIEATIDRTETQLAAALDSRFPVLATERSLTDKLTAIRRGQGLPAGKKLLIVIDQFEQWLHTVHEQERPELIRALRQCDGTRVQCIVLVRDDFWLALNRFMEAVETPLIVGQNVRLVDLFDLPHAKSVLTRLGRAFERIPEGPPSLMTQRFINLAVEYLAKDGKVFPVHLSLFAEMVKARDWVPDTLSQLGGAIGVGVQFLRESFSAAHAPMGYRIHEDAVRHVLEGLLPEVGTQIKTRHRTVKELQVLSGYGDDAKRFESLMAILEGQLKLISPVDVLDHSRTSAENRNMELHYQLSHDFLVPSIREWLYSEQRKTYAGRCRLMLAEQTAAWMKQPIRRNLPLWRDWIQYRCLLRRASLSDPERRMLQAANQQLGLQTVLGLFLMVFGIVGVQGFRSWNRGHALLDQLHTTSVTSAPAIIEQLQPHRRFAESGLKHAIQSLKPGSAEELNLRLAQVKWDAAAVEPLLQLVLSSGDAPSLLVTREALFPFRERCLEECWKAVATGATKTAPAEDQQRAYRAALLLAKLDPPEGKSDSNRWTVDISQFLSEETVRWALRNPDDYRSLVEGMRPVAAQLTPSLSQALGVSEVDARTRSMISFLKAFHEHDDQALTAMLIQGSPWQWDDLRPAIKTISPVWLREALKTERDTSSVDAELRWERRLSTAGAILLTLSPREDTWNLLRRSPQPGLRSHLIDRMAVLGVKLSAVEDRLAAEAAQAEKADPGILSGLLMALGQYPNVRDNLREATRQQVRILYETHPDASVHSSTDWLMGHCQMPKNTALIKTEGVTGKAGFQWRLTPEGHVMIRLDGTQEPGIGRVFEICATEVTVQQYQAFNSYKWFSRETAPTDDCPINVVKWPEALLYCDWLSAKHGLSSDQFCCPPGAPQESPEERDKRLLGWGPDDDTSYYQHQGYRVCTSREWEFACRAGTQTRWFFGSDPDLFLKREWVSEHSRVLNSNGKLSPVSRPVGRLLPNDFGLFDTLGNVMEWAADGPAGAGKRYVLGGASGTNWENLVIRIDDSTPTNTEFNSLGFRIARTVEHTVAP